LLTKSIRLNEEEADNLQQYVSLTGEVEASVLKRAAMRGLKEMRLEQGLLAFIQSQGSMGSSEAAQTAGIPRAEFLQSLVDRGISMFQGSWSLAAELATLAEDLGDEKLASIAAQLQQSD
jgi:predicted HTH domain antitoxin